MDDNVYLSISFVKIDRANADAIVKAALTAAGTVSVNVHYDKALEAEDPT